MCKDCPLDRFNPQGRYSPESMDECRSHYHKPVTATMHLVLFLPGNRTDPAVYYCDHMNGWVSKNKSPFCKVSYQPCECVQARHLCPEGDLLPGKTDYLKCFLLQKRQDKIFKRKRLSTGANFVHVYIEIWDKGKVYIEIWDKGKVYIEIWDKGKLKFNQFSV